MIHLLLLLSSQLSTGISLDFLDEFDSEWVAPGWEIFEEIRIDPLDYVEPLYDGPTSVGCQAFEIITAEDSSSTWRLIVCGRDKLVVFQGDWPAPREWAFGFPAYDMVYSSNGRYVLVLSEAYPYDRAQLFDIDEWAPAPEFNPSPEGRLYGYLVTNLGEIAFIYFPGHSDGVLTGRTGDLPSNPEDWRLVRYPIVAPDGACLYTGLPGNGTRTFGALDLDGNLLWSVDTGDAFPLGDAAAAPGGSLVFVGLSDYRLLALDAQNGRLEAERDMGGVTYAHRCTNSDEVLATVRTDNEADTAFVAGIASDITSGFQTEASFWSSGDALGWRFASAEGYLLARLVLRLPDTGAVSFKHRNLLVAPSGQILWASEKLAVGSTGFNAHGNHNLEITLNGLPLAIATDGDSVYVLSVQQEVDIHGIRSVQ